MSVLAALDDSTAAVPVLTAARAWAGRLHARLTVLHVREDGQATAAEVARWAGVALDTVEGDPVEAILRAAGEPSVRLVVLGVRGLPLGPRQVGHIATAVLERTDRPVLVVPPDAAPDALVHLHRALVPLDGTPGSTEAVADALAWLREPAVDVIGLHVFDAATAPRFWDADPHAVQAWGEEFRRRWCGAGTVRLLLRRGPPADRIVEVAEAEDVHLIALGWSRDLRPGHAAVVRRALQGSRVPVLLVPVSPAAAQRAADAALAPA